MSEVKNTDSKISLDKQYTTVDKHSFAGCFNLKVFLLTAYTGINTTVILYSIIKNIDRASWIKVPHADTNDNEYIY